MNTNGIPHRFVAAIFPGDHVAQTVTFVFVGDLIAMSRLVYLTCFSFTVSFNWPFMAVKRTQLVLAGY